MNKKKILLKVFLPVFLICFTYLISFVLVSLYMNSGKIIINPIYFFNKYVLILWGLLSVILVTIFVFAFFKYKFIMPNKILTKNDRADSNLFDNQEFMDINSVNKKFGNYDFNDLPNTDAHGYIIKSVIEQKKGKKNLKVSLVPNYHACLIGTTGTGKSTILASPTIQANAVSKTKPTLIINDISGELYRDNSAQLKKQGYNIFVINLTTPQKSIRYNPLSLIWDMYKEYKAKEVEGEIDNELLDKVSLYIADIADFMCINNNKNNTGVEWQQGAKGIVQAVIWALLEDSEINNFNLSKDMFNIAQLSNILNKQKDRLLEFLFDRNLSSKTFDYAGNINDNSSEKTVDSYLSTLSTSLSLFLENGIQYITSATDIDISSIANNPTAIFVNVPPSSPSRQIVASMLYTQIYKQLEEQTRKNDKGILPRPVYYVLDEFGNLPKLKDFPIWIATSRKMNIYFFIMLQSNKQLDERYGKDEARIILNNCQIQMLLGSSILDDIKYFKELFGTYTAFNRNQSFDTDKATEGYKGSASLVKKDLVTSSELQQIPFGTMYTYILREKPLKTKLLPIFNEDVKQIFLIGTEKKMIMANSTFENKIYNLEERSKIIEFYLNNSLESLKEDTEKIDVQKKIEEKSKTKIEEKSINKDLNFIKK